MLYLNHMKMTNQLLALQFDPNRRNGADIEDGWGGEKEAGRKQDRAEEVRQGTKEGKEGGTEAEPRTRGSAPRFSINRGASVRLCLTREE